MNTHLSSEDFVDALDGAVADQHRAHLDTCEHCRQELEAVRAAMTAVRDVSAPEPSPLFWDHFSARVAQATAETPVAGRSWWEFGWRPAVAIIGAVALLIVVGQGLNRSTSTVKEVDGGVPVAAALADDGTWSMVVGMAAELEWSDVSQAAEPAQGTADAMIADLTQAQRDALARLLQQEIGDQ